MLTIPYHENTHKKRRLNSSLEKKNTGSMKRRLVTNIFRWRKNSGKNK